MQQRNILKNWFEKLKADNEILSCFYPSSWASSASTRRGIMLLAKVVTLLFICCLAAPEMYLCPEPDDDAVQITDDDVGLTSSFVEDYPDFIGIQKQEGTSAMLWTLLWFVWDRFMDIVYTTLWTLPALALMNVDLQIGELLDNTDRMHEERLLEVSHLAIVRPQTIATLKEALIAESMLHTLDFIVQKQSKIFNSKGLATHVRTELTKTGRAPVTKTDLQQLRAELKRDEVLVKLVRKQMKNRVTLLQDADNRAAKQRLEALLAGQRHRKAIRKEFQADRKQAQQMLEQEVSVATMPKRMHYISVEHEKICESFDGRLYKTNIRVLAPAVRTVKRNAYLTYCATDMGSLNTRMTRKQLLFCKHVSLSVALIYLLACTFYIFATIASIFLCMAVSRLNLVATQLRASTTETERSTR